MAKKAYIGVATEVPIYETTITNVDIIDTNIADHFTVNNGDYYFKGSGGTFTATYASSFSSSTATTTLTALSDMDVSFTYSYSLASSVDKFTLVVAGTTIENAVSGATTTKTYSGHLYAGDTITFEYAKERFSNGYKCTFSNMTADISTKVQTGTEIKDVARKIEKGYIGISAEAPVYGDKLINADITTTNITSYFTVSNGTYYFKGSGRTFTTTNGGKDSSTATTTLTALSDMDVSFTYSYSSEKSYDKFTLVVAGTTIENAVSGATTTKTYSGSLTAGQTIKFTYSKDSSTSSNDDKCTFYDMVVTTNEFGQIGTEIKEVARKIRKAYIGIGGLARPCWGMGKIEYYGTASATLSNGKTYIAAATAGNYALFGGGGIQTGTNTFRYTSEVDVFDNKLVKTTTTSLSQARGAIAATSFNDYAVFAGGSTGASEGSSCIDVYNSSLVRSDYLYMSKALYDLAAASVGDNILIGGGYYGGKASSTVSAYNSSFTNYTTVTDLSKARGRLAATSIDNYAIFGGGYASGYVNNVEAYNTSLTQFLPTVLRGNKDSLAAASVNNYAIFGGGEDALVDAYDTSLNHILLESFSNERQLLATTSINGYALFGGGTDLSKPYATMEAYDASLTKSTLPEMSTHRFRHGATTVGDYALFGGGSTGGDSWSKTIDVYTAV